MAVSLSIANETASLPVAWRLYLPELWAQNPALRQKAKIPDTVVFKTKPQIALDHIHAAAAAPFYRVAAWQIVHSARIFSEGRNRSRVLVFSRSSEGLRVLSKVVCERDISATVHVFARLRRTVVLIRTLHHLHGPTEAKGDRNA